MPGGYLWFHVSIHTTSYPVFWSHLSLSCVSHHYELLVLSSPTGEQFLTCKEVSSFLLPFTHHSNAQHLDGGHARENVQEECIVATENVSCILVQLCGLLHLG